jgi:hypothetical protein
MFFFFGNRFVTLNKKKKNDILNVDFNDPSADH